MSGFWRAIAWRSRVALVLAFAALVMLGVGIRPWCVAVAAVGVALAADDLRRQHGDLGRR